ncbi:hypothetical protein EW146_g380 [Bondarzewia mesenterica]|uniref:Neuroguidin n=1 Tax=Bondarzewia mesenterica TaxID=1095465 RepID=A0A4S4M917_9AGAM|nr:hypothetical protein EW146_g380 [Bondarzewia mesenterica]
MDVDATQQDFCEVMEEMTRSLSSVRELLKTLRGKQSKTSEYDFKDGISLLSLKHHLLLSYIQSLVLVDSRRALGHSLNDRTPPPQPFSLAERASRGSAPGDLVDSMIEGRIVLEKIKILEGRMRYQIEKLVRVAEDSSQGAVNDPLAFRPNPQNLMNGDMGGEEDENEDVEDDSRNRDGIYRPPKLAPMPYTETNKDKRARRVPVPSALSSLAHLDPSRPFAESTSGLGAAPSMQGARARDIQRMTEFEEENMTRLVLKKKDEKRRRKDEEDIALGGTGGIVGKRRGGGLEDEFADVLRSVGRSRAGVIGDGYEELRTKGRKQGALARARTRDEVDDFGNDEPRQRKRSRFEKETRVSKKRMSAKNKK